MTPKNSIIANAYEQYAGALYNYVAQRINDTTESEDIVQDVFVRLICYDVIAEETVKSLCYTIANNIVIDHIRRHYKRQEVYSYAYDMMEKRQNLTPEQIATFHDLAERERCVMMKLSPATARVYEMTQMEGMDIEEVSQTLGISRRTVECHQYKGRKYVREQISQVI